MKKGISNVPADLFPFCERIKAVFLHSALTQRDFAQVLGISQGFLSDVLAIKSRPSIDMMIVISNHWPEVSLAWLWRGEGEMLTGSPSPTAEGLDHELRGLQELQVIARQGRQEVVWRVMNALNDSPKGLHVDQLIQLVDGHLDKSGLEALLVLLRRQVMVRQEGGRWFATTPRIELQARDLADMGAMVERGILTLMQDVLPALEHKTPGRLVNADLHVSDVSAWMNAVREMTVALIRSHDTSEGHPVRLLMASAPRIDKGGE